MNNRNILISVIVLIVILISIAAGVLFYTEKESIYFTLASGVLASIVASLIYGIFNLLLLKDPVSEKNKLKDLINEFQTRQLSGVVSISPKFEQNPDYWNEIITQSSTKLDMLGHAFTTWTHPPHSTQFAEKIVKIAKSNGKVRIVILCPKSQNTARLSSRIGKKYSDRVNETLQFFNKEVYEKLSDSKKQNVIIKLESDCEISYMYINNGNRIVVSPYYAKQTDSKDNLVIELDSASKFTGSYGSDFEQVFKSANQHVFNTGKLQEQT